MCVQGIETEAKGENAGQKVDRIGWKEYLINCSHAWISVDFAQLSCDEVAIEKNVHC